MVKSKYCNISMIKHGQDGHVFPFTVWHDQDGQVCRLGQDGQVFRFTVWYGQDGQVFRVSYCMVGFPNSCMFELLPYVFIIYSFICLYICIVSH